MRLGVSQSLLLHAEVAEYDQSRRILRSDSQECLLVGRIVPSPRAATMVPRSEGDEYRIVHRVTSVHKPIVARKPEGASPRVAHGNEAESELSDVELTPVIATESASTIQSSCSTLEGQQMVVTVPPFRESTSQRDSQLALPNFGSAVSLFNATVAAMMGMRQTLLTGPPAVWQGLVSRVQTTLRGSADDMDGYKRTRVCLLQLTKHRDFYRFLDESGLFSNHGPMYFVDTKNYFSKLKLPCYIARIHSEAAVEKNARELKEYIEDLFGAVKRVMLLGHSKGGVDAAAACAKYWPDLKDKVVGLVVAQSPYGGSPVASDILREGQIADFETKKIQEIIITKVLKGDMQALENLTYEKRREFVASYPLPPELLTLSFHTQASRSASVLSTMSHIYKYEKQKLPIVSASKPSTVLMSQALLPWG